jgi:hypothetical protein
LPPLPDSEALRARLGVTIFVFPTLPSTRFGTESIISVWDAQEVEHLPSKCEALSLTPNMAKKIIAISI